METRRTTGRSRSVIGLLTSICLILSGTLLFAGYPLATLSLLCLALFGSMAARIFDGD